MGRLLIPKELRSLYGFETQVELVPMMEGILIRNPMYVLVERKPKEPEKKEKK